MPPTDDLPSPDPAWFIRPDGEDGSEGIHGVMHTRRVMIHAAEIAGALRVEPWVREVVVRAALWHDIGRTDDGGGYYHGAKSAGKAVGLGLHRGLPTSIVRIGDLDLSRLRLPGSDRRLERAEELLRLYSEVEESTEEEEA